MGLGLVEILKQNYKKSEAMIEHVAKGIGS
jgi:hypothetical protein